MAAQRYTFRQKWCRFITRHADRRLIGPVQTFDGPADHYQCNRCGANFLEHWTEEEAQ